MYGADGSRVQGDLPDGVECRALTAHVDARGQFTEIFREEWRLMRPAVQWNMVRSRPGVLRGVHVHRRHADCLLLVEGRATIGLRDLRSTSNTPGAVALVALDAAEPAILVIPAGVAHGFLFHAPSLHIFAVTEYWDPADELGCHWADPELGISWPIGGMELTVSPRDAALPPLRDLMKAVNGHPDLRGTSPRP